MSQFAGELPVASLAAALPYLRRPFTAGAVGFKIQSTWTTNGGGAMVVTYIDARLVTERLNGTVAVLWTGEEYVEVSGGLECRLTIDGVTRRDVGEASGKAQAKALRSDAFKRAAVRFGVGVSIYAVPLIMLKKGGDLREVKVWNPQTKQKDKTSFVLTDKGDATCRERYTQWLESHGVAAFGEPLDHGDVAGSQGDWEVDPGPAETDAVAVETNERPLTADELRKLIATIEGSGRDVEIVLGSIGVEATEHLTNVNAFEIYDLLGITPKATAKAPARRRRSP